MTESEILRIAKRLFSSEREQFSVERLAAEAGVSRSTIYRRFGGREGIARTLAEQGVDVGETRDARSRVLEAVGDIVGGEGRLDATVEEIADRANVSSMTIFRLFGDKSTLLQTFLDSVTPRRTTIPSLHETDRPVGEVLTLVATVMLTFARDYPGLIRISLSAADHEALHELQSTEGTTREALVAFMKSGIERGSIDATDPGAAAAYFGGMLMAEALAIGAMGGEPLPVEEAARRAVSTFLRAFGGDDV